MHVHVLGICGTFMGGLAILARELGHNVSGSDGNGYPPMSAQLAAQAIPVWEGYEPAHLDPLPDLVVIGNALSRGNPLVEAVLDRGVPYTSGPQWLAEHVLPGRWVIAVAGTHGKTTAAALVAWILEYAKLAPGFLIGGVPENFGVSARLGRAPFFVVEADEYDTGFFDKRAKFLHYHPKTAVLNNLEFDHADIFSDLAAIKQQFHYFVRTVPGNGLLIVNGSDRNLADVVQMGCWTPLECFTGDHLKSDLCQAGRPVWSCVGQSRDYKRFDVYLNGEHQGTVRWDIMGRHNAANALAAVAAARHAGVPAATALESLNHFRPVKRRMELRGVIRGIRVYDDFAHHPTAIRLTLEGLRATAEEQRIFAVLEPRSNSMRMGVHRHSLAGSLAPADRVLLFRPPDLAWNLGTVCQALGAKGRLFDSVEAIVEALAGELRGGDHVVIMSNGAFGNIHTKLLERLQS